MKKILRVQGKEVILENYSSSNGVISFNLGKKSYVFSKVGDLWGKTVLQEGNKQTESHAEKRTGSVIAKNTEAGSYHVLFSGVEAWVESGRGGSGKRSQGSGAAGSGGHLSPMPGKIFKVLTKVGDKVKKGQVLLVLEAMKMEHSIKAEADGVVMKLPYKLGDLVQGGTQLLELKVEKES